jgi:subtilase family serine protease
MANNKIIISSINDNDAFLIENTENMNRYSTTMNSFVQGQIAEMFKTGQHEIRIDESDKNNMFVEFSVSGKGLKITCPLVKCEEFLL